MLQSEAEQLLQRFVIALKDGSASVRRKALSDIRATALCSAPLLSGSSLCEWLGGSLGKALLRRLDDSSEAVRTAAAGMLDEMLQAAPDAVLALLPYAMPVLEERLRWGEVKKTPTEPSEEVRLQLACLLTTLVGLAGTAVAAYAGEVVQLAKVLLQDPWDEVNTQGCTLLRGVDGGSAVAFLDTARVGAGLRKAPPHPTPRPASSPARASAAGGLRLQPLAKGPVAAASAADDAQAPSLDRSRDMRPGQPALGLRLQPVAKELVAAVLPLTTHKRHRLRVAALRCLRPIMHHGAHEMILQMVAFRDPNVIAIKAFYGDDLRVNFCGKLATDSHVMVRLEFLRLLGDWMLTLRERTDHEHRLLPYVLSALDDESPAVVAEAVAVLEALGAEYEVEHGKDLKDTVAYLPEEAHGLGWRGRGGGGGGSGASLLYHTEHGPPVLQLLLPNPFTTRPRLGTRLLAQVNFGRVASPLAAELSAWQAEPRQRACTLIRANLILMEDSVGQHLQLLLPAFCRAISSPELASAVSDCCVIIGSCVEPPLFLGLLAPRILEEGGPVAERAAAITVLKHLLRGAAPRSSMGPHLPGLLHTLQPPSVHLTEDSQLRSAFASLLSCVIPACGPAAATTEHRSALLWLSLHAASQAAPPRAASLPPASHASSAPRSAAGHAGATGDRSGGSGSSSSPAPVPTLGTLLLQLASAVGRHGASAGPMASFQLLELEPDDDHPPAGAAMAQERTHEADTRARECPTAAVQALLSESRPEFIQRIQLSSSTNSTLQAGVLAFLLLPNSGGPSNAPQLPPSQALLSRVVQAADAAAMTHATHSGTRASEPNSEAHGLPPAPTAPAPCCPSGTAPPDIWSDASASTACFRHLAAQLPWLRSHPASAGSVLVALECSLGCHPGAPQQGLDLPTSPRRRPKPLDPGSAEVLLLELLLPALAAFQATAAPAPSSASPAAQRGSSSSTPLLLALRCAMAAVSSGRLPSSLLQRCLGAGPLQEVLSACVASHHVPCRLQACHLADALACASGGVQSLLRPTPGLGSTTSQDPPQLQPLLSALCSRADDASDDVRCVAASLLLRACHAQSSSHSLDLPRTDQGAGESDVMLRTVIKRMTALPDVVTGTPLSRVLEAFCKLHGPAGVEREAA
ncbi:MAG: hypothetical protein WDW36_009274 [Sanguina aurantia]